MQRQVATDYLADDPIEDYEPMTSFNPDESILIIQHDEHEYPNSHLESVLVAVKLKFRCTDNIPEYEAYIIGLQAALDVKINY